jgi:hypothetical protein
MVWRRKIVCAASKCLEPTLGVFEGQADDAAGNPVEAATEEPAIDGLMDRLLLFVEPARADGDVSTCVDGFDQTFGFFDGCREIGVGKHDDLACRLEKAVANGVAFAAVAGVLHEVELGVAGHPLLNDGGGVVRRAVVDYEDFSVPLARFDAFEHAGKCAFDAQALVIRRNDDAESRVSHGVVMPFVTSDLHRMLLSATLVWVK